MEAVLRAPVVRPPIPSLRLRAGWGPTTFVLANAIAFVVLRPGVPDLWAARARAFASAHGVGLTYWFGWFGGSTPADYSVISPYLCALLGTELVAGLAAVAISALTTVVVRDTARPTLAAYVAGFSAVVNLWCGRVPFLLGCAFGVAALVCVRRRWRTPAAVLAVLAGLASPVSAAFLGLGLSGALLARRTRAYRGTILPIVAAAGATLVLLAALFGVPGPEPLPVYLICEIALVLGLMLLTAPPDYLRITLIVSAAAAVVVFAVPNGLGANFARLAMFCLPAAVVAVSRGVSWRVAALTAPVLVLGALTSTSAVVSATKPGSTAAYYAPLAAELDSLPAAGEHRLELVSTGHAAYAALLGHAVLARGWETQQDLALNRELLSPTLDTGRYRAWLDDNAVGYVALSVPSISSPEVRVISAARAGYLREIWRSAHWRLYAVLHPTPIVSSPAVLTAVTQAGMTVQVPCACRVLVRVRWSKYLTATARVPAGTPDDLADSYRATLARDGSGWTALTSARAGTYQLSGTLLPA